MDIDERIAGLGKAIQEMRDLRTSLVKERYERHTNGNYAIKCRLQEKYAGKIVGMGARIIGRYSLEGEREHEISSIVFGKVLDGWPAFGANWLKVSVPGANGDDKVVVREASVTLREETDGQD